MELEIEMNANNLMSVHLTNMNATCWTKIIRAFKIFRAASIRNIRTATNYSLRYVESYPLFASAGVVRAKTVLGVNVRLSPSGLTFGRASTVLEVDVRPSPCSS